MKALEVGMNVSRYHTYTQSEVNMFAAMSGDTNLLHINHSYAEQTPFGGTIVHGALLGAQISCILGTELPGLGTVYESQELRFLRPVRVGTEVKTVVLVEDIEQIERGYRVWLSTDVVLPSGKLAAEGRAVVQVWPELQSYSTLYPAA